MATQKQIEANRKNARKSTGPKSPAGKAKSSMNALKHGLSTPYGLLPNESEEEYAYHREELLDELYPDSTIEQYLADRIVYLSWTLKRAAHFTRVTLHNLLGETCGHPLPDDEHPDIYLARMVVRDFSSNHVMERLEIYERRIENSLYKTMREYEKQKKQSAQTRRSQPRPSFLPHDRTNPTDCHLDRGEAERRDLAQEVDSTRNEEPAHTESPGGWDESHQSSHSPLESPESNVGWDESHQSPLAASDEPRRSSPDRQPSGLPTSVLKERTQFEDAETPNKSRIHKDLRQHTPSDGDSEQTRSDPDLVANSRLLSAILCSDDAD